ncbi:MAG: alkaline phosphatase D family protein [Xanthobacteraceae bacterium]
MDRRFVAGLDVDAFATVNRRVLLRGLAASTLVTTTGGLFSRRVWANPVFAAYPFSLGVASGDPAPDGFVIWTKIAPSPLAHGGGMPKKPVEVEWSVASDERMTTVAAKGTAIAHPELGHAVHVEVGGLEPAREYFYRFTVGGERSRIGRAKTLPPTGASTAQVRFGVAGCQRYEDGHYLAYRHLANERLDFVFHYGDYIYERRVLRPGERQLPVVRVMPGEPDEIFTLDDYRHRYAVYKSDPNLQRAHASTPFVMTFDDHEVSNNWAGEIAQTNKTAAPELRALFLLRRAAAFQAWYEHMPVRRATMPRGPDMLAYRRFAFGDLLGLHVLDTRQHRSDQPCEDGFSTIDCKEALEPHRTMLGEAQEHWLYDGFKEPKRRWTVLGQQVVMMPVDFHADPAIVGRNVDAWDGAVAARERLLSAAQEAKLGNLVVLTGDTHSNWAGELKRDYQNDKAANVGIELAATSISSNGDGYDINERVKTLLGQNPHVKFFNSQRGYVRHVVTPQRWRVDYRVVERVSIPKGRISNRKSFVIETGNNALLESSD